MGKLPVPVQIVDGCIATDRYGDVRSVLAVGHPVRHASALGHSNVQAGPLDGKPAEICHHGAGGSPHPVKQCGVAGDEIIGADINLKTGTTQIESLRRVGPSQDFPRTGQAYQSVQRFAAVHFSATHLIVTSSVLGQGPRPAEVARNPTPPEPSCKQGIHGSLAGAENQNDQRGDEEGKGRCCHKFVGTGNDSRTAPRDLR